MCFNQYLKLNDLISYSQYVSFIKTEKNYQRLEAGFFFISYLNDNFKHDFLPCLS